MSEPSLKAVGEEFSGRRAPFEQPLGLADNSDKVLLQHSNYPKARQSNPANKTLGKIIRANSDKLGGQFLLGPQVQLGGATLVMRYGDFRIDEIFPLFTHKSRLHIIVYRIEMQQLRSCVQSWLACT